LNTYGKQSTNLSDALAVGWQVWKKSLTQGPKIQEFESVVASKVGAKYAVAVSSATAGLHLALLALELEPNSEVVTSPISFLSSSNVALYSGLKPRFVDINPDTLNISVAKTIEAIAKSDSIKALVAVHMAGSACEMEELSKICKDKGVSIIEDAAHALGGLYSNMQPIGNCAFSDMTVFSFHPVKSVTTGEGGVVTTNNEHLYRKLLRLRSHGINQLNDPFVDPILAFTNQKKNPWYHEMQTLGFHYRLTEIQAALGISQMKKLDRFIDIRRELANNYDILFKSVDNLRLSQKTTRNWSAHHIYVVQINFSKISVSRADIMTELKKCGIGTQVHYKPIPLQPYYVKLGYETRSLPCSLDYYAQCLSLPIYPGLKYRQQKKIVKTLLRLIQ